MSMYFEFMTFILFVQVLGAFSALTFNNINTDDVGNSGASNQLKVLYSSPSGSHVILFFYESESVFSINGNTSVV